jgi:glycopeptide antibiotics resistance protein
MSFRYYAIAAVIAIVVFFVLHREEKGKRFAVSLLAAYLFLVLCSTVFRRRIHRKRIIRLEPIWWWKRIRKYGWDKNSYLAGQVVLNILMLTPIGFLMPFITRDKKLIVPFGFLFSAVIEVSQLLLRKGYFEVDDIIHNTLGVALAYGINRLMAFRESRKIEKQGSFENKI